MVSKIKKIAKILTVSLSLLGGVNAYADHSFLVAPGRIEADLTSQTTRTVIVTNTGSEDIRLEIFPEYLPIGDGQGELNVGVSHLKNQKEKESLEDYITVSPKVLKLKPGQRRDVKVNINGKRSRTNKNAKPLSENGDYRTHLIVRMKEAVATKEISSENNENLSMNLDIKFETAIAIYGRKGEPNYDSVKAECSNGSLSLNNDTPYKVDGKVNKNSEIIPFIVMRNSTRNIPMNGKIEFQKDDSNSVELDCGTAE